MAFYQNNPINQLQQPGVMPTNGQPQIQRGQAPNQNVASGWLDFYNNQPQGPQAPIPEWLQAQQDAGNASFTGINP